MGFIIIGDPFRNAIFSFCLPLQGEMESFNHNQHQQAMTLCDHCETLPKCIKTLRAELEPNVPAINSVPIYLSKVIW